MGIVGTVKIQVFKEDDAGETGRNPRFLLPKEKKNLFCWKGSRQEMGRREERRGYHTDCSCSSLPGHLYLAPQMKVTALSRPLSFVIPTVASSPCPFRSRDSDSCTITNRNSFNIFFGSLPFSPQLGIEPHWKQTL